MKNNNLKIAIIHEYLLKIGGAEQVLAVLHELFPEAPIFTLLSNNKTIKKLFPKNNPLIINCSLNKLPNFIKSRSKLLLSHYPSAIEEFDLSKFDIVISSSNSFAHGVITPPKTFHLSYCHSPMRYAWDYTNEYLSENKIGFGVKGLYVRKILKQIRIWDRLAAERVDYWIANSANVQKRIEKYYNKKSVVINPPVDLSKIEFINETPQDHYVIISRLEPYKKVDLAIQVFNKLNKKLIIIGKGSDEQRLKKLAKNNIQFLGWLPDDLKYKHLRSAKALIFPGEDDFGITPVEAMACGRPVIALKKGGVAETIQENITGLFFDNPDANGLMEAILKFESVIDNFNPTTCRKSAEKYSTESFKKSFLKTLDQELSNYTSSMK